MPLADGRSLLVTPSCGPSGPAGWAGSIWSSTPAPCRNALKVLGAAVSRTRVPATVQPGGRHGLHADPSAHRHDLRPRRVRRQALDRNGYVGHRRLPAARRALPVACRPTTWCASSPRSPRVGLRTARACLHRDIKPANILLGRPESGDPRVMLADFGIARWVGQASALTGTNMTVGTVAYAAPEQLKGESIDGHADQYAPRPPRPTTCSPGCRRSSTPTRRS